jgi:hypothetical protein
VVQFGETKRVQIFPRAKRQRNLYLFPGVLPQIILKEQQIWMAGTYPLFGFLY